MFINGNRIGKDTLAGAWTTYNERVLYWTYDLSSYLQTGTNVVAVMLGDALAEIPVCNLFFVFRVACFDTFHYFVYQTLS